MEPCEQLRDWLQWKRDGDSLRRGGVPFEQAWPEAVAHVCKGREDGDALRGWFEGQREVWRRCFELAEQTPGEYAFTVLGAGRGGGRIGDGVCCDECGEPIPAERLHYHAKFCSETCRKAASRARIAA